MRAEQVIKTLLMADSGIAALVAARIYPSRMPQNTLMPAMAYEYISGNELNPISATAGQQIIQSRMQINCLAKTYAEVKSAQEAVRLACLYKSGLIAGVRVLSITRAGIGGDGHDDALALYMQSVDYIVTHYES